MASPIPSRYFPGRALAFEYSLPLKGHSKRPIIRSMTQPIKRLSVLMPVYNEARTLRTIVARVLASPVDLEIELVCVDDGSKDESLELLRVLAAADPRIKVFTHPLNRGKGAAIRTAIAQMTGDVAIVQDSDLEYDPAEFGKILKPILEGRADAVFGSRFASSPERRVLFFWHSLGNKALTFVTNVLNDLNLTDMETCYKAVRADILRQLRLESERFGIEPEITSRLAQWGARIYEVPISYHGRTYVEGKNIGWRDGVQALWLLAKFRFFDTRFTHHRGMYAARAVNRAKRYNRWLMEQFAPYLGDRVMEAGCGIGNFTELLLSRKRLVCVDPDRVFAETLQQRFGHLANVRVIESDLADPLLHSELADEALDSVLCLNVLEHISEPGKVLSSLHQTLRPGGTIAVLVPNDPALMSDADDELGHLRRYTVDSLAAEMNAAGFDTVSVRAFNRLGGIGWAMNRRLKRQAVSSVQMRVFDLLVPVARLLDTTKWGRPLTLLAVGRKAAKAE